MDNISRSDAISMIVDSDDELDYTFNRVERTSNKSSNNQVKVSSSSLGLSLLQSYDDLQDDSNSEDDDKDETSNVDCETNENSSEICANRNTSCNQSVQKSGQPSLSNLQSIENETISSSCQEIEPVESRTNDVVKSDGAMKNSSESNITTAESLTREDIVLEKFTHVGKAEINGTASTEHNSVVLDEPSTNKLDIVGEKVDEAKSVPNKPFKKVKLNRSKFRCLSNQIKGDALLSPSNSSNSIHSNDIALTNNEQSFKIESTSMNGENESIMDVADDECGLNSSDEHVANEIPTNVEEALVSYTDSTGDENREVNIANMLNKTIAEEAAIAMNVQVNINEQEQNEKEGKEDTKINKEIKTRQLYLEEQEEEIKELTFGENVPEEQEEEIKETSVSEIIPEEQEEEIEEHSVDEIVEEHSVGEMVPEEQEQEIEEPNIGEIVPEEQEEEIEEPSIGEIVPEEKEEKIEEPSVGGLVPEGQEEEIKEPSVDEVVPEEQEEETEKSSVAEMVHEVQEKLKNNEETTTEFTLNNSGIENDDVQLKYSSDEEDVFKDAMDSVASDHNEQEEIQGDETSIVVGEVESKEITAPNINLTAEKENKQRDDTKMLIQDDETKPVDTEVTTNTAPSPDHELEMTDSDIAEAKEEVLPPIDNESDSVPKESSLEKEKITSTYEKEKITAIEERTMEVDERASEECTTTVEQSQPIPLIVSHPYRASEERSKLEQALTRKLDPVRPAHTSEVTTSIENESPSIPSANIDSKENLKLHISLQGNRASIKKSSNVTEMSESTSEVAPIVDTTTEVVTPLPEQPRVKRKYTRRKPPIPVDQSNEQDGKAYKLRARNTKKSEEGETTPPATKRRKSGKSVAIPESIHAAAFPALSQQLQQPTVRLPYVHTAIDKAMTYPSIDTITMRMQNVEKVQPLKLKIKCSPVTIEKVGGNTQKEMPLKVRNEPETSPWSQPDMLRVERLLKDSNVTITPVVTSNAQPSTTENMLAMQHSMMPKDKCMSATITPITSTPIYQPSRISESMGTTLPYLPQTMSAKHNFNILLKQVLRPDDKQIYHYDDINSTPSMSTVDVKSEIRKKLAQAERRKTSGTEENILNVTSRTMKSVPGLLPINIASLPPGSEVTSPIMTSQQNKMDTSSVIESVAAETSTQMTTEMAIQAGIPVSSMAVPSAATNAFGSLMTPIPPTGFPKRRGRPTKAMVAARNALRQSQEVIDNLIRHQSVEGTDNANIASPHFMIPFENKQIETTSDATSTPKARRTKKTKGGKTKEAVSTLLQDETSSATVSINNEENAITDADREAEQLQKIEQERIRKEQERERKNELRRQKAKERSDLIRAKRLRQKQKAEERLRRVQEQRRLLQEEKKKLEEQIKKLPLEDATRMGMDDESMHGQNMSYGVDDDSSNTTSDTFQRMRKSRMEVGTDADSDLTVDQIAEYQWPIQGGELYMIQEQISNFLGVKSFKRKYPDIKRRPVDSEERAYLVDSGLVSESLCDLGITAVCSAEVLDIMCNDFPDKYEELRRYMREKQMKELSFKQRAWANGLGYKLLMADGSKQDLKKRAMEAASNWNSALNKSRTDDRRCAMDLQTFIVHYPKSRASKMTIPTPKMGSFPVSILPGQYCDFYKRYTSDELRYMPLNTVLYGPLKPREQGANIADCSSQTESDDSSSSDESSSTTSDGTQDTEDTIEEIDTHMSILLDDAGTGDKTRDTFDESSKDAADVARREMLNGMREALNGPMDIDRVQEVNASNQNTTSTGVICKICFGNESRNKESLPEVLIRCSQCQSSNHPTCLDLSSNMVPHMKSYEWQCPDCKSCARCKENADEDKMLFCDNCDRGYHIYCVGLKKVPSGSWQCQECNSIETNDACNSISTDTT